jgi:hypothetical protein
MPFAPHQSLAGCITNIPWRLRPCDRVIADYRCRAEPVLGSPHIMGHLEVGERVRKGAQVCDSSQIENVVGSSCYRNPGHA